MPLCPNCTSILKENVKYCHNCGQSSVLKSLTIWSIVGDFFSNLFNLEAKIWRTLIDIWHPTKLTKAYIHGQRATYYNPLRFFLIILFGFFALIVSETREELEKLNSISESQKNMIWGENLMTHFDSLVSKSTLPADSLTVIKTKLLEKISSQGTIGSYYNIGTIESPPVENILESIESINDSVRHHQNLEQKKDSSITPSNTANLSLDNIDIKDLFVLTKEELLEKHSNGTGYWDHFLVQGQKIMKDLNSSVKFLIGNGAWAIISLILLISAFFKLLYWRKSILYAEHLLFKLYGHTRMLLLGIIFIFANKVWENTQLWYRAWILIGLVYLFLGMYYYFNQSIAKTIAKLFLTLFAYIACLFVCICMIFVLSFIFL